MLLPLIEFAHNAWPHCSTHWSPFKIWYRFHPTFKLPLQLQTRLQSVDEHIKYLEQICKEVTAALHIAAQEIRSRGPPTLSHTFYKDNLVLLEATNLQTTHLKAKLAPWHYGPFKVLWASLTNCKLALPPQMRIHPVFHNLLLKPYVETSAHGPNFAWPPPEIVGEEEGHYKIKKILQLQPTRNKRSTEYLVHWKGYTNADRTWVPAKELTHAKELVQEFLSRQKSKEGIQVLQAQQKPKEGILSRTESVTSHIQRIPSPSPPKPTPKPKYSHVVESTLQPHDPGKPSHDLSCVQSCDTLTPLRSHDIQAHDPGKVLHDLPRDWSSTQSQVTLWSPDCMRFSRMPSPLIGTWKTMGTINKSTNQWTSHKTLERSNDAHPLPVFVPALKYGLPVWVCMPTLNMYAQTTLY